MLLGPSGQPLQSFKKDKPIALGPSFGNWLERDVVWGEMPGGAILQFDLSRLTLADYRAMRHHPQINACLSLLTFMLHQVDWHIECEDKKIADETEDILRLVWTRLVRALSQAFWAGFSPTVIEFENNVQQRRVEISKFKDLLPEECTVHWKLVEGGYAPPNHPKPKFRVFDGIDQWGAPFPIPAENSLWYPLLMENGNYYGRQLLKAAFAPWYFSMLIHLFANRYFERFGEPLPIGRADFEDEFTDPNDSTKKITGKEVMEQALQRLRSRATVTLPSDAQTAPGSNTAKYRYDIEYLESQMRGADFERYLSRLDEEMSLALFTPLLLMRNADVGSHNLGVQHTQTWLWMLNALVGDMKEYIDRYVLQRLKAYNFSPNAPRVEWKPKKMGKENQETLRAIISELVSQEKIGFDLTEIGEALGMTVKQVRVVKSETDTGEDDDRVGRPERTSADDDGPRGVGEPRATGREVSARVSGQVQNAWKEKRFGASYKPTLGFSKRFVSAFQAEGHSPSDAERLTQTLYSRMDAWMEDAIGMGTEAYSGPSDFMAMFDRALDTQIEALCSGR